MCELALVGSQTQRGVVAEVLAPGGPIDQLGLEFDQASGQEGGEWYGGLAPVGFQSAFG